MKRSARFLSRDRTRNAVIRHAAICEPIESRLLLSTISWTNRGSAASDTDSFNAVYGANANLARQAVDRAIGDWRNVITHFNHVGGGNTFTLNITAGNLGGTTRGLGNPTAGDGERVPISGSIQMDDNAGGDANGWYFDPVIADDGEFPTARTNYSADGTNSGCDFYYVAVHELGHCLGITSNTNYILPDFITSTGVTDPNDSSQTLLAFNIFGGPIEATFSQPGHLYEGPAITDRPDLPIHPDDLMARGRVVPLGVNRRILISDIDATILRDVYQYTITLPSTLNNLLITQDLTNDRLNVSGLPGNDFINIQGTANSGELHVTVNSTAQIRSLTEVSSVVVNGQAGNDLFRLEYNANRFTTFNGGAGTDTIDLAFVTRNLFNITGPVLFNGGADPDFMHAYDNNNTTFDAFFVDEDSFTRFGTGIHQYNSSVENVYLTTGTNHNSVNISRTSSLTKLYLNSSGGQDLVNIGPSQFSINGQIEVQNDPSFTTINIDDIGNSVSESADIDLFGQFGWISGLNATIFWDNADVQEVRVTTGSGADSIRVHRCSERLFLDNTGGRDNVTIGNGSNGMQQITREIDIEPTPSGVFTDLTFNDAASTTGRTVNVSLAALDVLVSNLAPVPIRYDQLAVTTFTLLGGTGNDTFNILSATYAPAITIDAGAGSDIVNAVGAEMTSLTVRGGTDSALDFLDVLDQTFPGNVVGGAVYPDRIDRDIFAQISQVFYSDFSNVNWYQQAQQNAVSVYGVSPDIGANNQFSIIGNSVDDYVQVHTHDAQGNPTINGNLAFNGGGGPDVVEVFSGPNSASYRFFNPFLGNTAYIDGFGAGWLAVDAGVENIRFFGSPVNDTFAVEKFNSGGALALFGGNGNDNCTIGNGNMQANLTSASAFTFNGGGDTDRFTIANGLTTSAWSYAMNTGIVTASINEVYSWTSTVLGIESQYVFAGSAADTFIAVAVTSGLYTEFNGFAGYDSVALGFGWASIDLEQIHGPVVFNAGTDGGAAILDDTFDSSADVAHLTANTLGAFVGDTLFGMGGSLTFSGLTNSGGTDGLRLFLGQGADTIYAQPLAGSRVLIDGGGPTAAPGDRLNLALADVQNANVTHGSSGSVTSSNRQTLNWTGMEQSTQPIDAIAPAVADIDFQLGGNGRNIAPQSLDITFSEAIGSVITGSSLSLFNATTSTHVPAANIAVTYDAATFTATYTFPGYPGGVLPNGTYQAQILAGLGDAFGNTMPASNIHTFIWAAGTGGDDAFRVARAANFSDIHVFFNNEITPAFVAGPSTAQIVLAGDSGNDSLVVDCTNLNPTPTVGGIEFDGGDDADSVKVKGSANVDGVTFLAGSIMPGATSIVHPNVETQLYDGGGGFDSLGVYGTTVILPVSQRFVSIDINQSGKLEMLPNLDGLLVTRALTMSATSTLDLDNSDMIVDYTGASELANITAAIRSARNGGLWNGSGITSSSAGNSNPANKTLGAMEATEFKSIYGAAAPFAGESIDTTAVLVKYTYYGDADFNGVVNFDDYSRIDGGFLNNRTGWLNGDFDGNGVVNFDDYSLIDLAFNTQLQLSRVGPQ